MNVPRSPDGGSTVTLLRPPKVRVEHSLVVVNGENIETLNLPIKGRLTIGRSPSADVVVQHNSVSREHAVLEIGSAGVVLRDLGSHNGTLLAGRPLSRGTSVLLREGEVIQVGAASIFLECRTAVESAGQSTTPAIDFEKEGVVAGPWMRAQWPVVARIARGDIPILIVGETGVGKEVLTKLIHGCSSRADRTLLSVNCSTLPEHLVESELFGHERGAFTGASTAKPGLLEGVGGGTLFLDEIGELPLQMQSKLLRVLESGEYRRVGGLTNLTSDVRVVAATNRDLDSAVVEGAFRPDLLYRLNAFTLEVPPLRKRRDEIVPLARLFAESVSRDQGTPPPVLDGAINDFLESYDWPGNVRELRNTMERAVLLAGARPISAVHLPEKLRLKRSEAPQKPPKPAATPAQEPIKFRNAMEEAERQMIIDALATCAGNQTQTAKLLGISRRTLVDRLNKYDLPRPRKHRKTSRT